MTGYETGQSARTQALAGAYQRIDETFGHDVRSASYYRMLAGRWPGDTRGDDCAAEFMHALTEALEGLDNREREAGECGFQYARRQADHIGELRRAMGILADLLADWEMINARDG